MRARRCGFFFLAVLHLCTLSGAGDRPTGAAPGYDIVFDSNRSGTFGIYRMNLDGSDLETVVDTETHEIYPNPSPDGHWIAYARAKSVERDAEADIYRCRVDGSDHQLIVRDGTFPEFSSDGEWIYFERSRKFLVKIPVGGGESVTLVPRKDSILRGSSLIKPTVSPDGRFAAIISNYPGTWFVGIVEIATGDIRKVGHGCEPNWFDEGKTLAWVSSKSVKERTGIKTFNIADGTVEVVQDDDAPFGHEYFPWMEEDGKFLLWAACPPRQHEHADSNYQIFVREMPSGAPVRLSHDKFTNRWPKGLRVKGPK